MASGKGTVASYLETKHNASNFQYSKMLRDILDRLYLPQNRDTMPKCSKMIRDTFGNDIMARTMAEDVKHSHENIIVSEGIRRLDDIKYLQQNPNFILIRIDADEKIRYSRLTTRTENTDDKTKTFNQFISDHQKETELTIPEVMNLATETLNNDGSLENLHTQIDSLTKKYQ